MKEGGGNATTGGGRRRFRNALVVAEMALAVVLLVGAGLMLRTLWSLQRDRPRLQSVRRADDADFAAGGVVPGRRRRSSDFYSRLIERMRSVPGVTAAGAARSLPLGSTIGDFGLVVDGYVPPPGTSAKGDWQIATDGYMEAIGEQVVRGRGIERDRHHGLAAGRADQRGDGAALLGGTRSDRRPLPHRRRRRSPVGHRRRRS